MTKLYRCDYIDSGINFGQKSIYVCCKSAHEGGGMPVLSNSYKNLDWEKIFEQKKQWQAQIASGNPPERCTGCSHIVETAEIKEDYTFRFVDINSFINCNSQCCYCDCWSTDGFQEKSLLPIFEELFDKQLLKDSLYGYIQFAGGEPALMIDFDKITDLCIKNGMQNFIINSNGIKFSEGIKNLLENTKTNLFISIDSGTKEVFEKIKNVPCFEKVITNIERYAKSAVEGQSCVWSKYIIIPQVNDTMEEINKWYDLSIEKGIKAVVLDVEREWFKKNGRIITKNMKKMIENIQNRCKKDKIKLDYYEQLKCLYKIH